MRIGIIAAIAAVGGLLFGYDTGVISGALLFLREAFHLSSFMLGVVTSIALAGAAGGAAVAGLLTDRFGRRPVLVATAMIFIAGAPLAALADSLTLLLGGRLLVGIGIGGASMLTPLYLSEITPSRERGALVSFNQLALTSGILASYLVGYGFAVSCDGCWAWARCLACSSPSGCCFYRRHHAGLRAMVIRTKQRPRSVGFAAPTSTSRASSGSCEPISKAMCKRCPKAGSVIRRHGCR
jgi:MFS family permease